MWEVKHVRFHPTTPAGLPGEEVHLLMARHVLQGEEVKYFLSNAATATPTERLLWVALTRHRVERCFQDQKSELGMDHFEGRTYKGLMRHLYLTQVSYLFAMRAVEARRGENPEWTVPQIHRVVAAQVVAKWRGDRVTKKLLEQLVKHVEYHQARNRQARKSHNKRTRRQLRAKGIRLTDVIRCKPSD